MKKSRKYANYIFSLLLALHILVFTSDNAVLAMPMDDPIPQCAASISPQSDETVWIRRTYNGREQMRLWSCTEGRWLTDWIDC